MLRAFGQLLHNISQLDLTMLQDVALKCCLSFAGLTLPAIFSFKFVIFQVPEEKLFQILFEIHPYTHSFTFLPFPNNWWFIQPCTFEIIHVLNE